MQTVGQLPIELPKDKVVAFCRRHHIYKLSLFGSVLREDFTPESDIDFLVEFLSGTKVTYFDLAQMERELSQMLDGRKIESPYPSRIESLFSRQSFSNSSGAVCPRLTI